MSINDIASTSGYSIARVRHLLDHAGTHKRGRGRPGKKADASAEEKASPAKKRAS
jgi:hypothetical protein